MDYYIVGCVMGVLIMCAIIIAFDKHTFLYKQGYKDGYTKGCKDGFDAGWIDAERTLFTHYVPKDTSHIKESEE